MIQSMSGLVCQIFAVSGALLIPQHGDGVGFGGIEGLLHLRRVGVSVVVPLTGKRRAVLPQHPGAGGFIHAHPLLSGDSVAWRVG